jgi:hypothetical protein
MAGTTGSSGLNNMLSSTNQVQTTLPSWMDTAQQNVINQANTAVGGAPAFGQTTSQQAVNTLQGPNSPFTQAQGSLNTIASGAANPWIVDQSTGNVTPNTNTALGGLFQAQDQQLNQLLPTLTSGSEAGAIGSGNFGSLRGQTAVDTAKANAQANMLAQQMTAAIQNQQTGASAAGALGNVGAQGTTADLTTGAAQMNAPFQGATNYANLVNSVNAPTTVSQQNQMSPLTMLGSLAQVPSAASGLLGSLGITGSSFGGLGNSIMNSLGLGSSGTPTTTNSGGTANNISNSVLANATPTDINNINNIVAAGPADTSGGSINGIDTSI